MGKRSNFVRKERDFYPTPYSAVVPLLPHLSGTVMFDEPCAGEGDLVRHLHQHGHCVSRETDIKDGMDARSLTECTGKMFITNPPWPQIRKQGEPTVSIALHLSDIAPTWLLLSADFCHNRYFVESGLYDRCVKIVSVGRVSWEGNGVSGKDNCAWYLFEKQNMHPTVFVARAA